LDSNITPSDFFNNGLSSQVVQVGVFQSPILGFACSSQSSAALIRRPVFAQSATAAFLFGAGDVIAQQVIERQGKNHDVSIRDSTGGTGSDHFCAVHAHCTPHFLWRYYNPSLGDLEDSCLIISGALFGPALTKWYQLLNRIKFSSPTKAVIYRV
jgi:protein Mpv17